MMTVQVRCIIHRVEDITEFLASKLIEIEQDGLEKLNASRADNIEAELFFRSRELVEIKKLTADTKDVDDKRQQAEERFQLLAENITDVFWLTDFPQTRVLYVSPSFGEIPSFQQTWRTALLTMEEPHPSRRLGASAPIL